MERLTYWCDNGHGGGKWFVAIDAEGREDYGPHVDRLAAYEETGLEPGEIEQLKGEAFGLRVDKQELEQYRALGPIDRLRELAEAALRSRMADILTIIAAVEWMALGLLVLWKLKGWNRKMEELYEDMKKQWEAEHETS